MMDCADSRHGKKINACSVLTGKSPRTALGRLGST
jgi:hypothetical protein